MMTEEQKKERAVEIYDLLRWGLANFLQQKHDTTDNCVIEALTMLVAEWFNVAAYSKKEGTLDLYLKELEKSVRETKIFPGGDPQRAN